MTSNTTDTVLSTGAYLDVIYLEDKRYCVKFIKSVAISRLSYSRDAQDVVKQAQRAGNIPVHTNDEELRRICREQQIELL